MALFRQPETTGYFGAISDEALTDGAPVSVHLCREFARGGNRQTLKGDLMSQVIHRADEPMGETPSGSVYMFPDPTWQHAFKASSVAPRKKPGLVRARIRIRAEVTTDANLEAFVASRARPDPARYASTEYVAIRGTGAAQDYDKADVVVWDGLDERISLVIRALLTGNEPLMNTATYGGPNTGSVIAPSDSSFAVLTGTWSIAPPLVEQGGHYVRFLNNSADRVDIVEPRRIVATSAATQLHFWPAIPADQVNLIRGAIFEIRELPRLRLISAALYSNEGSI